MEKSASWIEQIMVPTVQRTYLYNKKLKPRKMAIDNVKAEVLQNPAHLFFAAGHWFLVFSVMLKSCLIQLYVGPCHVLGAEIAGDIIPYTPDPATSDFFLFPKIKEHLTGKCFANDEDLKDAG